MNATCIRVLLCLIGGGSVAAFAAAAPDDSPSREMLELYSYQPPLFTNASIAPVTGWPSPAPAPLTDANLHPKKPVYYDFRHLEEEISQEKVRRRGALFSWTLFHQQELEVFAKPKIQEINIPWSPMIAVDEVPASPTNATRRLKVGIPLVRLSW